MILSFETRVVRRAHSRVELQLNKNIKIHAYFTPRYSAVFECNIQLLSSGIIEMRKNLI